MIEFLICFGAFLIVLLFIKIGMQSGAFLALGQMLTAILSLYIALRYWFPASRWASSYGTASAALVAAMSFWMLFVVTAFILTKLRENAVETFESVHPSLIDRALAALFGLVSGTVVAAAVMMTLSILAPEYWTAYKHDALPLPIDRVPLVAYRFVETRIAGIAETDATHTLLPTLKDSDQQKPVSYWR